MDAITDIEAQEMADLLDTVEGRAAITAMDDSTDIEALEMVTPLDTAEGRVASKRSIPPEESSLAKRRTNQEGRGPLDRAVNEAIEERAVIPNIHRKDLELPEEFRVISDTSYTINKFRLTTRRLVIRSHEAVGSFVASLLNILLPQVDPEDRVALSVSSELFPQDVGHISFRRTKFLSPVVVLKAIKAMIQSGTLNEHFLDAPVQIVFNHCEGEPYDKK